MKRTEFNATSAVSLAYITNFGDNTVFVIDTATNTVKVDRVPVGAGPIGVAVTPNGTKVYVVNYSNNSVSVIDTATYKMF